MREGLNVPALRGRAITGSPWVLRDDPQPHRAAHPRLAEVVSVDRSLARLLLRVWRRALAFNVGGGQRDIVACSVPPPSIVPRAVMHLPCATACKVAGTPLVYCVLSVTVTSV